MECFHLDLDQELVCFAFEVNKVVLFVHGTAMGHMDHFVIDIVQ